MFILTLAVRRNEKLVHVQTVWLLSAGLMVTMGGRPWSKAYLEKKLKQLNQVTTFLPRIKKLYLNNQLFMKDGIHFNNFYSKAWQKIKLLL